MCMRKIVFRRKTAVGIIIINYGIIRFEFKDLFGQKINIRVYHQRTRFKLIRVLFYNIQRTFTNGST